MVINPQSYNNSLADNSLELLVSHLLPQSRLPQRSHSCHRPSQRAASVKTAWINEDVYSEASYNGPSHQRTTSIQRTLATAPIENYYSAYNSDSNLPPEDSLQIKDKSPAPKVSFIRRLHCNTCTTVNGVHIGLKIQISSSRLIH